MRGLYEVYIPNLGPIRSLEPFKKFSVGGWVVVVGGGGGGGGRTKFSVQLWSQAEQFGVQKRSDLKGAKLCVKE